MAQPNSSTDATTADQPQPVAVVCVGMAGSGKTTFMQRINSHLHAKNMRPYVVNLDPAVRSVPFDANIDIRDSVNYKEVMKQYNLGPNGGILTSLNLFATKIDQVLSILEKRCNPVKETKEAAQVSPESAVATTPSSSTPAHIIVDTPGQIEVFVWSASGNILLSALASSFPTVIAYVIDTPRTTSSTSTFMSNMLYAISILYKTRLPMILVFNKTDVKDETEAVEWMRDFDKFQDALRKEEEDEAMGRGTGASTYMNSLLNSMSLVLEEFYNSLSVVGVSSMSGEGVDDFFAAVEDKRLEFQRDYAPELERRRTEMEKTKEERREQQVARMMQDMAVGPDKAGSGRRPKKEEPETVSEAEEMTDDDEHDGDLLDRDEDESDPEDKISEAASLQKRYQDALEKSGQSSASAGRTGSNMADYIQASNQR